MSTPAGYTLPVFCSSGDAGGAEAAKWQRQKYYNKWENTYGENAQKSLHKRFQNYKKVVTGRQAEQIDHSKNRGVR